MRSEFDPYHRWLGIPPKHQPPNYYRLLGLELFEDDPDVIRDAAERQIAHVRSYQLGPQRDLSQEILNELATAKACLLNKVEKSCYDLGLRGSAPDAQVQERVSRSETSPLPRQPQASRASESPPAAATSGSQAGSPPPEILVSCGRCHRRFLAQSWLAGKSSVCPACGETILVPSEALAARRDLARDTASIPEIPNRGDFADYSDSHLRSASRRTLPCQTYTARKPARTFGEANVPAWLWPAMGVAFGLAVLVLLVILVSTLWTGGHAPNRETDLIAPPASADSWPILQGDRSNTTPPANLDSVVGVVDSVSGEPQSETHSEKIGLREHASPDGGYSMLVPGPVRSLRRMDYSTQVERCVDAVELPRGTGSFEVSYADHPLSEDLRSELARLWHATAALRGASATESVEVDYKGHFALEKRFVSTDPLLPTGRVLLLAVRRGDLHRLYMIVRSGPEGCAEGDEAETIFQSFRVLP